MFLRRIKLFQKAFFHIKLIKIMFLNIGSNLALSGTYKKRNTFPAHTLKTLI